MNIKIKLVTLTLAGLFIVGIQKNSFINVYADSSNEYHPVDALGCGIDFTNNLPSLGLSNLKYTHSIFSDSVLETRKNISANEYYSDIYYSYDYRSMSDNITADYLLKNQITIPGEMDSLISSKFKINRSLDNSMQTNSFYYYIFNKKIVSLSYFYDADNYNKFIDNYLSSDFLNRLDNIKRVASNPTSLNTAIQNLFSSYGTHTIINGEFGGLLEYSYILNTNEYILNSIDTLKLEIESQLIEVKDKELRKIKENSNLSTNLSIGTKVTVNNNKTYMDKKLICLGGKNTISSSLNEELLNNWVNSINTDNSELVGSNGGIVPIWNYIKDSTVRNLVKTYYISVIENSNYYYLDGSLVYNYHKSDDIKFGPSSNKKTVVIKFPKSILFNNWSFSKMSIFYNLYIWKNNYFSSNNVFLFLECQLDNDSWVTIAKSPFTLSDPKAHVYSFETTIDNINPFNLKTSTRNYISLRFIYDANGSGGQPYGASELNFQFKLF